MSHAIRRRLSLALLPMLMGGWAASPAALAAPPCGPFSLAFYEFGALYYLDASGQPTGIDKELVDELQRRSGCSFDTRVESRVRIWDQMLGRRLDITVSGLETPERLRAAEFWPYFRSRNHALMRRELARQLPSMAAFEADASRRVVVVKSFKHGPTLDAWIDGLRRRDRVHEVPDFESALRVFRAGRVDLMVSHPINLPRDPEFRREVQMLDWAPQDNVRVCLVVSRDRISPSDRQRLKGALLAMVQDGSVDAMLLRHAGPELAPTLRLEPADHPR